MKDYKRLTKRGVNGRAYYATPFTSNSMQAIYEEDVKKMQEVMERLCDLEDKIENGTLVELPCKVGEMFYEVIVGMPIQEWKVESIAFNTVNPEGVIRAKRTSDFAHWKFWVEDCGTSGTKWFATKAEAEEKLKELQGDRK